VWALESREAGTYQNTFRRLHLCQWTQQDTRWMDIAKWEACGEPFDVEHVERASLLCRPRPLQHD